MLLRAQVEYKRGSVLHRFTDDQKDDMLRPYSMRRLTLLLMCCVLFPACTSVNGAATSMNAGGANASSADVQKNLDVVSIRQVLDAPAGFDGKEVMVRGVFLGWKGACPSSTKITRSDWILEDETGCIYVTGRIPDNVSPANPREEHILVKGHVLLDKKGVPTIQATVLTLLKNGR